MAKRVVSELLKVTLLCQKMKVIYTIGEQNNNERLRANDTQSLQRDE
jgi:hypothetical protein